jgi:hypothetical protein
MNIVYDWGISILVLLYMYALRRAVLGDIYADNVLHGSMRNVPSFTFYTNRSCRDHDLFT